MKIKNLINFKIYVTYLATLLIGRHKHVWVSEKVDPCIGVILDHRGLLCSPVKKIVIEGLYSPPSNLSRQQSCPPAHYWKAGYMPPYRLSRTKTRHSLEK
jgi:hypothetical protein